MTTVHWIALVLAVIGALNWGLVGLFQLDLVAALFGGSDSLLARVVYIAVGVAGIVLAATSARREPQVHDRPGRMTTASDSR